MGPAISRVGLLQRMPDQGDVIVGRQVAIDSFTSALVRHGAWRCEIFATALEAPAMQQRLEAQHPAAAGRFAVHDRRRLVRGLDAFEIDAWHDVALDTHRPFELRARFATRAFPITLVHHTLSYKELLHDQFLRLLLAQTRAYDALICTSSAARRAIERTLAHVAEAFERDHGVRLAYRGRYETIPLAVDTEVFRPREKREIRRKFKLPDDAFVLLWVGRLSAIDKADLLLLIDAFAALASANPSRKLLLLCAGTERAGERFGATLSEHAARRGVGDRVLITKDLRGGVQFLHAAADVFVSPVDNLQESFGLAPIEAMACGVPQVVADWDGYRDGVVDGVTGYLVPTRWARCDADLNEAAFLGESAFDHLALSQSVAVDMEALQAAVQRLLDDEGLRARLGEQSRARALERYAAPVVVGKHEALWRELANEARASRVPERAPAPYTNPRYADVFGHYATELLELGRELELAPQGARTLAGEDTPKIAYGHWGHLQPELFTRAMAAIGKGRCTLSALVAAMGDEHHASTRTRHAMWLLKYGLIRLA